jgi:hypothetical protein
MTRVLDYRGWRYLAKPLDANRASVFDYVDEVLGIEQYSHFDRCIIAALGNPHRNRKSRIKEVSSCLLFLGPSPAM